MIWQIGSIPNFAMPSDERGSFFRGWTSPREKAGGLQDPVCSPELPVFLRVHECVSFIGADPGPATGINLRLP